MATAGVVLGVLVALARVRVGASSAPPQPLLAGLFAASLLLPRADPPDAHQWLTAPRAQGVGARPGPAARRLAACPGPYVPPCAPQPIRFGLLCT